ncbi:MAG TPA: NADH-quinone oxidoreductase subunit L [Candidatus Binataceae bacterium]|nr:NADH-quinone oxidoreductase subunit L [Candidatus Binataceae bacterium]
MTVAFPALGLILLCPVLGVVFNLFWGARAGRAAVYTVGVAAIAIPFAVALWAVGTLLTLNPGQVLGVTLWPWIEVGRFHVQIALRLDSLAAVMVLVVSGVGALIHLYSCGYMAEDPDFARFFTYMNLFVFSMLLLVLAANLLLMFVGWEGVGLCSYLLIAFWYTDPQFAYNGRKAFVVNRIGDAGFILGLLTLFWALSSHGFWTLDFVQMQSHIAVVTPALATAAGLLLFAGATGKSAQIPLYVWLPDAMVGPTPVSALIHAATMVTAGVYMVARLNFLYMLSPQAMEVVAAVGTATAFFAATIAIVQPDIKRVLAYSTISQLGYMFMGVGVGAFAAGISHVMTHAFFKALLFLCAGSVIHGLHGEQDMNHMGGLARKMPITCVTMWMATLAIVAIPPFAGFFTKDLILSSAYSSGHFVLWLVGLITAALTGLYMFRLIFMTFHGKSRVAPEKAHHIHESPLVMTLPLMVLAALSLCGGWIALPQGLLWGNVLGRFLASTVGTFKPLFETNEVMLSGLSVLAGLTGLATAWLFYIARPEWPGQLARSVYALYRLLLDKYFIDQIYDRLVSRPLFFIGHYVLWRGVDSFTIDGVVEGSAVTVETGGDLARRAENGNVQSYALVYLLGAVAVVAFYVYRVLH